MVRRSTVAIWFLIALSIAVTTNAVDIDATSLERRLDDVVRPFLKNNCLPATAPRNRRASWT